MKTLLKLLQRVQVIHYHSKHGKEFALHIYITSKWAHEDTYPSMQMMSKIKTCFQFSLENYYDYDNH